MRILHHYFLSRYSFHCDLDVTQELQLPLHMHFLLKHASNTEAESVTGGFDNSARTSACVAGTLRELSAMQRS